MTLNFSRRAAMKLASAAFTLAGAALGAQAQAPVYPAKPIVIKTAFPAGGPADASFRAASEVLQRSLGQPLISDYLPGASGSLAAMNVLRSNPDGYTLLGTTGSEFVMAPLMMAGAKYKVDDFKLVGVVGLSDMMLVSSPAHSFKNIDELIEFAKKQTDKPLSIAHWGRGSTPHLMAADFQARTGTKFIEVPYKGVAPVVADLGGGQVDLTFLPLAGPVLGLIQQGRLRPIGMASNKRNPALPNVPTLSESPQLKDFEFSIWSALLVPAATPAPIVDRLAKAMGEWTVSPENAERIVTNASRRIDPMTPQQAAEFLRADSEKLMRVAKSLKLDPL